MALMRSAAFLPLLFAALLSAQAQYRPFDTEPDLSNTFPLVVQGDNVCLKYPVLINTTSIIPANAILRVIYVPPRVEDDRMRAIRTSNNSEVAWSRNNALNPADKLSPSEQARLKISRETIWADLTHFQLALSNLGSDEMRIVYLIPGATPADFKLYDEHVVLPEGLLLAEINKTVTVLAVDKTSSGAKAGIKAGDVIVKTGDAPTNGSLSTFLTNYHATRQAAETAHKTTFNLTVKTGDTEHAAAIPLPPSISGGFLDTPINTSTKTTPPSVSAPELWENTKPTQPAAPNPIN